MPRKGRSNEQIVDARHPREGGDRVAEACRRGGGQRADVLPVDKSGSAGSASKSSGSCEPYWRCSKDRSLANEARRPPPANCPIRAQTVDVCASSKSE